MENHFAVITKSKLQFSSRGFSECGYFECLTSDQLGAGVLIDFGHVDDSAGLLGVAQSAQAFLHIAAGWAQRGDHGGLGVPTEALFQQPAEEENLTWSGSSF